MKIFRRWLRNRRLCTYSSVGKVLGLVSSSRAGFAYFFEFLRFLSGFKIVAPDVLQTNDSGLHHSFVKPISIGWIESNFSN